MKKHIDQLHTISRKPVKQIIGLMSGTSLDGLDIALCRFTGSGAQTQVEVTHFATLPYDEAFKSEIRKVFAKKEIDFQHFTLLNVVVAERHAALINRFLIEEKISAEDVDLIASHGQTVFHAPRIFHGLQGYPNATLQIGDGDHIACRTGIVTISDFRQKHLAAGGEGAPLALYGDYFLFSRPGEDRFLLNIGGIGNFTFLPGDGNTQRAFATDTGPGNTLLDAFAREMFGVPFDADARIAGNGRIDTLLLELLKEEPFFEMSFPKTAGPELFSSEWVRKAIQQLPKSNINPYDLMATLTRLSAETIADAVKRVPLSGTYPQTIFLSGGGAHNPLMVSYLKELLPEWTFAFMEELGVHGDAKEAVLFAALANETVAGSYTEGTILGGIPLVGMGKISFPD